MNKQEAYAALVGLRKGCRRCGEILTNPADPTCCAGDSEQIGPWSRWQGKLDAKLVIVGQDWGDKRYFDKYEGRDQAQGNTTNENLQKLLSSIGIQVKRPRDSQTQVAFFTNLILCLKHGGLQESVEDQWMTTCAREFLLPLVGIVQPKVVVALGLDVTKTILGAYNLKHRKSWAMSRLMEEGPYWLNKDMRLFPVYHCGAKGVNMNRPLEKQFADWVPIGECLKGNTIAS